MLNKELNDRRLTNAVVAMAAVVAANVLLLQTHVDITGAAGAEVSDIPAAPAPITSVTGPRLSLKVLAAEREFFVPVRRAEIRLPDPPEIRVDAIRETARTWLGDGVVAAPSDAIEVAAPDLAAVGALDAAVLDVPELEPPALAAPPIRRGQ